MIQIRRVLCPTDFSAPAQRAADLAAEMASRFGARLLLVHVIPELDYPTRSFGMSIAFPHLKEELRGRANEALQAERKRLGGLDQVDGELRDGVAFEQILECVKAHQADLVVMGTHGHSGFAHFVLGSTAERVVRMATCPVLTVRHPG